MMSKQPKDIETELDKVREQKKAAVNAKKKLEWGLVRDKNVHELEKAKCQVEQELAEQLEEMEDELQQTEDQNTQTRKTQFEGVLGGEDQWGQGKGCYRGPRVEGE